MTEPERNLVGIPVERTVHPERTFPPSAVPTHAAKLVKRGDKLVCETCGKVVMPAPNADISYGRFSKS